MGSLEQHTSVLLHMYFVGYDLPTGQGRRSGNNVAHFTVYNYGCSDSFSIWCNVRCSHR